MATWLAGRHGDRFKAICSERAVNNMFTEEYTSDIATIFRVEIGPDHLDAPEEYERMSPIRFVRDINVPMLIIHSEKDFRCPISQAEELFVAMRLLGKDVTFYRFPGEGHELSRSGSPIHRRQRAEIILDFFAEHLTPHLPRSATLVGHDSGHGRRDAAPDTPDTGAIPATGGVMPRQTVVG